MKYFIGPMSKNVVDTLLLFINTYGHDIVFIPSRRQIEYTGGYVNNWSTKDFYDYINKNSTKKVYIERDHGGPGQGLTMDDGFASLDEDIQYMDIIHIDPWKKYHLYEDGLEWTVKMIKYAYSKRSNLEFEVGTEEGIRPFQATELDRFVTDLKLHLTEDEFNQIKYLVIQCGTRLLESTNIGHFNSQQLLDMLALCKKYNLIAKEHNGDWVNMETLAQKSTLGLSCINIAPEFGEIETQCILNVIDNNKDDFELFYRICRDSGKWKKWVSPLFVPDENKEKLIQICGHYNFTNPEFIALKKKYPGIDEQIQKAILRRLFELHGLFKERKECIVCQSIDLNTYFKNDFETPCSFSLFNTIQTPVVLPYNILSCNICQTVQTKYLGDLSIIYGNNHVDSFGQTKNDMNVDFSKFITQNKDINGIIEIGACTNSLALLVQNNINVPYTIIEADYKGDNTSNIKIINSFVENVDIQTLEGNTIVLSHIFEHLYNPIEFLQKISRATNIKYIYFNHPDFEYYCQNNIYNILNVEHIYYFEKQMLVSMLSNHRFSIVNETNYKNHSIFIKFKREDTLGNLIELKNTYAIVNTLEYFESMHTKIFKLNQIIADKSKKIYIWPASAHTVTLFVNGLNYKHLNGILDNSPNKIGKILYYYNLSCYSLTDILQTIDKDTYIILGVGGNYLNELSVNNTNIIKFNEL